MEKGFKILGRTMKRTLITLIGSLVLLGVFSTAGFAQLAGYNYYKPITINSAQVVGSHSDFPVLISITDSDLVSKARSDGFDIVFTTSPGSTAILDHELESFNSSTGELVVWVKVPTVSTAGETIYMWYGNSGASTDQSSANTWSNQFRSVYHLGSTFTDASPNGNDGTNSGSINTLGKIGDAQNFDGVDSYIALDDSYASTTEAAITVSTWIRTTDETDQIIGSFDRNEYWRFEINGNGGGNGQLGWDLLTSGGQADFGSTTRVDDGNWRYVTGVYDNGALRIYIDGVQDVTTAQGTTFGSGNLRFGFIGVGSEAPGFDGAQGPSNNFNGDIDEFRISNVARPGNWIETEYNNQNNPSAFITVGAEADIIPPAAPGNVNLVASSSDLQISFDDVDEAGSGVASYSVKRSTTQGSGYVQIGTIPDDESPSYTYTDNTVVLGTTYYYVVSATDNDGNVGPNSLEVSGELTGPVDNTPPSLVLTTVSDDLLILDYDEALDESSVPAVSDFSLSVNSVSVIINTVSITGDKVYLNFSSVVSPGDNVELDYNPVSTPIQDLAGNDAPTFSNLQINNQPVFNSGFGPDPCPIVNGQDVAWACFDGTFGGTTMTAEVGGLVIGTINAIGANATFAPNALQEWADGSFLGDQFNGPQVNPSGASGDATSFDILIPSTVPSDAIVFSLNRLRPDSGAVTYTLEAFDGANQRVSLSGWATGQGTDGGVCTNTLNLNYTNGNETIEFVPTLSTNPSCASSSTPIWFRIDQPGVERIELRKVATDPDNIFLGMGIVADFGDAPSAYNTSYSSRSVPPAFHLLNNSNPNTVFFGATVDGDGNGAISSTSNGDDTETAEFGAGDDEDAISILASLNTAQTEYSTTLVCTDGAYVGGWIDFDQSNSFDTEEFDSGICSGGSVTLNWSGISGTVTGNTHARFRIASNANDVASPTGWAADGEVEDYPIQIIEPPQPDLEISKTVDVSTPVEADTIIFTVKVKNLGPDPATNIQVTDQLPTGVTYFSAGATQGSFDNGSGIWTVGNIAAGDSAILSIDVSVDAGTLGQTIINTASITSLDETDPNLSNNSASSGITVVPESADIELGISVDDNTALEGQLLTFTITATNNGPKLATGLTVIDQIPTGLLFQTSTPTKGTYNNSTGIWNIDTLGVGATETLTLVVSVNAGTEGSQITNSADVNSVLQTDPNSGNNTVSQIIDVVTPGYPANCNEIPILSFSGSTLITGAAGQVGATYRFNSVAPGVYAEFEIITINNAILVNFDQIASGGVDDWFQPQIEADDKNLDQGYIDFEISFYDSATGNPRYLTFAASAVDVDGDPNGAREFAGFQRLTSFTIETNTDLIQNTEGIFTTFESAQPVVVNGIDPNDTNNLAFTTYTNEPKFRLRAGVKEPTEAGFTQRLFAFNFEPCVINNFNNPTSSDIVDVSVVKTVDFASPAVGDTVTYTIKAKNEQGNSVGNVEITDELPNGLTFVSATATQGTYNSNTDIWDIGTLSGQQVVTLTLKAEVNTGQEGNTIGNTATLSNNTGTDGNASNNSGSVDIIIFDPGSGLTCNEPPLFSFTNPTLELGVPLQVNALYRFSNVTSGVDALVQVVAINNATLDAIDNDGLANSPANFSPFFTAQGGGGYVDFNITLVQTGTLLPVKRNFALTGLDIDGFDNGSGGTVRDYLGFAQNQSNTVEFATNLGVSTSGAFQLFESSVTTDGNGSFDTDHMAYIVYNYTSTFDLRTGGFTSAGYSDDRLVDIDFTQCRNQDFDNPVVTTRDADIAVVKTVDEPNPLENGTVNFTITATNNGPENATELDINETIPTGLTLVQATPSQGTYNQLTNLWEVGTLPNGSSATLVLETTVNSGLTQDSLVNKAFVNGLNQSDPTIANDTSKVAIYVSIPISGTVFEDITGDGYQEDTNFGDASGDQQGLEDVVVHLFKDGGDGLATGSDDIYVTSDTTGNTGGYTFQVGEDADFWIVVDSRSGELSNGTTWGEQTYAASGALCEDGTGSTTETTSLGHCFGGRRGDISDNIPTNPTGSDLANAEHVIKRTVAGSGITGIDFGFSFNVVTNIDDDDEDGTAARRAQGTLHQFILNANEIPGANSMRFVPAVPTNSSGSGGNWWTTTIQVSLPFITDPLTTIDGTAYQNTAPTTVRDDNTGTVGTGGTVGVDNLTLDAFQRKEFEVNLNDRGGTAFSINSTGAVVVRNTAFYNSLYGVNILAVSNGLIEDNLFGLRADGATVTSGERFNRGILFAGGAATTALIQENFISGATISGIYSDNSNTTITVFKNEITATAQTNTQGDAVEGFGTWTIERNLIYNNGNSSSSATDGGSGIEIGTNSGSSSGHTIRNNTISGNTIAGITVLNNVTASLIEKNIINGNGTNFVSETVKRGAGIKLLSPGGAAQEGIRITQNSFYDNEGISIDVGYSSSSLADGVSPNDGVLQAAATTPNRGLDYPVFTLATLENGVLSVEGYVGASTTKLAGVYTIEVYKAEDDGDSDALIEVGGALTSPHGEGRDYIATITTNSDGTFSTNITLPGSPTLAFNDRITAITISAANNTSEFSANQRVVPTGVSISGFVFHDTNHNMIQDATEAGLENVTIVLYNTALNNCKSVFTDSNGRYEFTNVLNGSYDLIESFGQSVPTPDICTPAETDPDDFTSTTPNLRSVTVNNLPIFQNFGDYEGIKITGTVFNDNGVASGTANDALRNGGEIGFGNQTVTVFTGDDNLIEQTVSAADGTYELYVPKSMVDDGGTVKVVETNGAEKISTGGSAGTTGGSYDIANDRTTFTITLGTVYTGVDFADVSISRLLTNGEKVVLPGAAVSYQHIFEARTAGDVVFVTTNLFNPDPPNWPVILYEDLNCNGTTDSGEPIILPTDTRSVIADQQICLVVTVTAPNGLNDGASANTTVSATFTLSNTSPAIQEILTRTDLTTVSTTQAGLVILKSVDKPQALPGASLVYSINYENLGDEPITQVEITDVIPNYTTYLSSSCGTLPTGITNCTITAPSIGSMGTVRWTFTGTLDPGQTGIVTFTVKIDD